jgi:hypothetical protein
VTKAAHMTASSPRARVAFKDRDARRLIKAVRAEGLNPTAVEVDVKAGRIRVICGNPNDAGGDLDKWLGEHP